jgi:ribonuclease HI
MILSIYTDGGARGNPGQSGIGVVVFDKDKIIFKQSKYLGIRTNNEAEYTGLVCALEWLLNQKEILKIEQVNFFLDSQLVVRQMQGLYKVKAVNLRQYFQKAQELVKLISLPINFQDIPREKNTIADQLANEAMDRKI